jgi:hypothetical protein
MEKSIWGGSITRRDLLRSITLFQSLTRVPEPPNYDVPASEIESTYRLSISREKKITSNLAFLAATSDDNLNVMAVCVEEHPTKAGITIRVAANSGELSEVVSGFEKVARILEESAMRGELCGDLFLPSELTFHAQVVRNWRIESLFSDKLSNWILSVFYRAFDHDTSKNGHGKQSGKHL